MGCAVNQAAFAFPEWSLGSFHRTVAENRTGRGVQPPNQPGLPARRDPGPIRTPLRPMPQAKPHKLQEAPYTFTRPLPGPRQAHTQYLVVSSEGNHSMVGADYPSSLQHLKNYIEPL